MQLKTAIFVDSRRFLQANLKKSILVRLKKEKERKLRQLFVLSHNDPIRILAYYRPAMPLETRKKIRGSFQFSIVTIQKILTP